MYQWLVFVHVIAAFVFVMSHGVSAAVALTLRFQRGPDRVRALLELSGETLIVMYVSLLLVLATGVWAGFRPGSSGSWWDSRWIWASLGVLVVMWLLMGGLATRYFDQLRRAVGLPPVQGGKKGQDAELATPEELEALLRSSKPIVVAIILGTGRLDDSDSAFPEAVQLPSGDVLCSFSDSGGPGARGGSAWARSRDGGETWALEGTILAQGSNPDTTNALKLSLSPDGQTIYAYGSRSYPKPAQRFGEARNEAVFCTSIDGGHTWSPPRVVPMPGDCPLEITRHTSPVVGPAARVCCHPAG